MLPSDGISAEESLYPQVGFITANQHVGNSCLEESYQPLQYNWGYKQFQHANLRIKQRPEQFDPNPWRIGVGEWLLVNGHSEGSSVLRHRGCRGSSRGHDSNNRLIEKWPSKNLRRIWRIWRSGDDAVSFSEHKTRPNCSESNAAHCIQDCGCGSVNSRPAVQSESANTRKQQWLSVPT